MYKDLKVKIRGVAPLLCQNRRLANPLDPIVKEIKKISGKRGKTEQDHELLADLEWLGGLYASESGLFEVNGHGLTVSGFGQPCIPGELIEAAMQNAGKKTRLGKHFAAGLISDGVWPIIHDGPKTIEAMLHDPNYRDIRACVIQRATIMRCRPIFHKWSLEFTLSYLPDMLNKDQVLNTLVTAGQIACIGTYRPKYGRFEVL